MRRRARFVLLTVLAAGLVSPPAYGAEDLPLRRFLRRTWTTDEGLPERSVRAIAQTTDGYLWIGTLGGLARFDGVQFEVFDPASQPALPATRVFSLLADADGGLWIGTDEGLWRWHAGSFTRTETTPALPREVLALAQGADRTLWLGTREGAIALRGTEARRYGLASGLPANWVHALAFAGDGTLWAATDRGTVRWEDGSFVARGTARPVWALAARAPDSLVALDEEGRLTALVGPPPDVAVDDLAALVPRTALFARDGGLWIAGLGLARLAGGRLRIAPIEAGIVDGRVDALFEDREGNLWLGVDGGGLVRLRAGAVESFGWSDGLHAEGVLPVLEDRQGDVWIGGDCGGLWRLRRGVFERRSGAGERPLDCVTALFESADGALWVADEERLDRLGEGSSRSFDRRDGIPGLPVRALAEDRAGTLWIASADGVARQAGNRFVPPQPPPPRRLDGAQALLVARDGALWVGFESGVAVLRGGAWTLFDRDGGLPVAPVRDLREDRHGAVWAATYGGGLVRIAAGRVARLGADEGVPDHFLSRLLAGDDGELWATGNRGIYRFAWDDLDAVADGLRTAASPLALHAEAGMPASECSGGGQPAGWRARDGRLWIPTARGLAVIDPRAVAAPANAPHVLLAETRVNGRPLVVAGGVLRVPPGSDRLVLRYTALSFVAPESARFRYRLLGHDPAWTDAGGSRTAVYQRLPPGTYVFEVVAATGQGAFGNVPTTLEIRVPARLWQTAWFQLLVASGAVLAALVATRQRARRTRRREAELARQVGERTRELEAEKQKSELQVVELAQKESELAELNRDLERRVTAQTAQIRVARDVAMLTLARLAELRDGATGRHIDRIAAFSRRLAQGLAQQADDTLGLGFVDHLYRSSPLHDIGKVAIPDAILRKPGPLTAAERRIMETHTTIGGDTLRGIVDRFDSHTFFVMGMEIAYHHHERWDGTGYPRGLAGEAIPLAARIVAVVDAYDALTSARPYKPPLSHEDALRRIVADSGTHFDPRLVETFVQLAGEIATLRERIAGEE